MAIKVALAAALLVALVALSTATSYTTTVTTISSEEEGGQNYQQQCRQQLQGRPFRPCQRYLRQRGPFNAEEEQEEEEDTANQMQYLQECCQQLKKMDHQHCGCEAIRHAVRQAQQGGSGFQTGISEQIYQRARALPRRCGMYQQQCRFNVVFV